MRPHHRAGSKQIAESLDCIFPSASAISVRCTYGKSESVLVDLVARGQKIKNAAIAG